MRAMIKNGKIYKSYKASAEAAEARAAELEAKLTGAAQTIVTLTKERDAARLELQQIRAMLDDGDRDDFTALDMVKRLQSHDYALQR